MPVDAIHVTAELRATGYLKSKAPAKMHTACFTIAVQTAQGTFSAELGDMKCVILIGTQTKYFVVLLHFTKDLFHRPKITYTTLYTVGRVAQSV